MPAGYEPYDFLKDTYEYSFFSKKKTLWSLFMDGVHLPLKATEPFEQGTSGMEIQRLNH